MFGRLKGDETAATLAEAVGKAETGGATMAARLEGLTAARAEAIVADDTAALTKTEAEIQRVTLDLDRTRAGLLVLRHRLARAQAAEAQAARDVVHDRGTAAYRKAEAALRDYAEAARATVEAARRIQALDAEIADVNLRLLQAGDTRQVPTSDAARPQAGPIRTMPVPVYVGLSVPSPDDAGRLLYPDRHVTDPVPLPVPGPRAA